MGLPGLKGRGWLWGMPSTRATLPTSRRPALPRCLLPFACRLLAISPLPIPPFRRWLRGLSGRRFRRLQTPLNHFAQLPGHLFGLFGRHFVVTRRFGVEIPPFAKAGQGPVLISLDPGLSAFQPFLHFEGDRHHLIQRVSNLLPGVEP